MPPCDLSLDGLAPGRPYWEAPQISMPDTRLRSASQPHYHESSVAEAIREAMGTSVGHAPEPHLPLRKASARQLRSRQTAPRPLFGASILTADHQVRGFNPSPVQASPAFAEVSASNEHAFAARDEHRRKPFNLPLGEHAVTPSLSLRTENDQAVGLDGEAESPRSRPPSSPVPPSPSMPQLQQPPPLRSHRSFGDGLRGLKHRLASGRRAPESGRSTPEHSAPPLPQLPTTEVRDSFRSALTSNSSLANHSSIYTDHTSWTGYSSTSDFVNVSSRYPEAEGTGRNSMTVEDAIGMYTEDGFDSARASCVTPAQDNCAQARPASRAAEKAEYDAVVRKAHRRSQSATQLLRANTYHVGSVKPARSSTEQKRSFSNILFPSSRKIELSASISSAGASSSRDRYGFKKVSHYVTLEQYDAWDAKYSEHLARRAKKWQALMDSYGLSTDRPFRFPPKSDKIKRYVRKGIPPRLRGAAWFWYAGGPSKLAKEAGLYRSLLERVERGDLSANDSEHIERDLNRTFPDNDRFKPIVTAACDPRAATELPGERHRTNIHAAVDEETPIVKALRRVLQAFAVHNPTIGYCQSLNFLAGLLLLFLEQDEEKAFVLLNIVTTVHLPGTHGVALEGANIDIAVLMSCVKDSLPGVWARLDDQGAMSAQTAPVPGAVQALRLPTISLATTAWFMSLFVGTLPIEAVLRVWDCLFFEGSKTLFRVALALFKAVEPQIAAVIDPMEIFQLVQCVPRATLDVNALLEICFKRRGGFAHISQELIERRRAERRKAIQEGVAVYQDGARGWRRFRLKTTT